MIGETEERVGQNQKKSLIENIEVVIRNLAARVGTVHMENNNTSKNKEECEIIEEMRQIEVVIRNF